MKYRRSKLKEIRKRIAGTAVLPAVLLFFVTIVSCNAENTAQLFRDLKAGRYDYFLRADKSAYRKVKKMGRGSAYYVGLHLKQAGYEDAARFYFDCGVQYGETVFRQLCLDGLYTTGSVEQRLASVEQRLTSLNKDAAAAEEREKLEKRRDSLLLRLGQYDKMADTAELRYAVNTMTKDIAEALKAATAAETPYSRALTDVRIAVFEKNYTAAWESVEKVAVLDHSLEGIAFRPVLSAIGKAAVYGSADKFAAAAFFEQLISQTEKNADGQNDTASFLTPPQKKMILFYANFYAARVYSRAGKGQSEKAAAFFYRACEYAAEDEDFDTALWYYLDTLRKSNRTLYLTALKKTAHTWRNPEWYSDLVEDVRQTALEKKDLSSLGGVYRLLEKLDLPYEKAAAAYVLARSGMPAKKEAKALLQEVYRNAAAPLYYRLLSAYHLGKTDVFPLKSSAFARNVNGLDGTAVSREDVEAVIEGLIRFGLYNRVYRQAAAFKTPVSVQKAAQFARELAAEGFYADSIRIAALGLPEKELYSTEYLRLRYPLPWKNLVEKYAAEFGIPEYLLYALIRSESFFHAAAVSHAGAEGLTQLMPSTAADIARKLKISEYNVRDPATNIRFGAYYLAEMIRRSDNRIMPALWAYNAGITQVRRWEKHRKGQPEDVFLESLPFKETRNYGKKILTAAVMYGYLYYQKKPEEVIKEIFSF